MAQNISGLNARRRRAVTKQQRAELRRKEIEQLTIQISILRGRLTQVTEKRDAMELPNLEGMNVEHSQYGHGIVNDQTDAVLTIEYADGVRKQKLPFVIASGCVKVNDTEATESCKRISDLDNEQAKLRKEIQYKESWISDLRKES
jgi:hypothetical protein